MVLQKVCDQHDRFVQHHARRIALMIIPYSDKRLNILLLLRHILESIFQCESVDASVSMRDRHVVNLSRIDFVAKELMVHRSVASML